MFLVWYVIIGLILWMPVGHMEEHTEEHMEKHMEEHMEEHMEKHMEEHMGIFCSSCNVLLGLVKGPAA